MLATALCEGESLEAILQLFQFLDAVRRNFKDLFFARLPFV